MDIKILRTKQYNSTYNDLGEWHENKKMMKRKKNQQYVVAIIARTINIHIRSENENILVVYVKVLTVLQNDR